MSDQRDEALSMVAAALQVDPGDLDDASAPGQTPGWDSLAHMRLVAALEASHPQAVAIRSGMPASE